MKKKFLTLILVASVSAFVLAGCGNAAEPASSSNVATNDAETAEVADNTEEEPEPECVHEWSDATFAKPKTCSLCGETEGEPRQSYFEEHGENVPDAPVECTVNVLNYDLDNPEEYQMTTDGTWEQIACYSEPAEEEGYQLIYLVLSETSQTHYYAAQDIYYNATFNRALVYDWYTGQMLPVRTLSENDALDFSTTLDIDGISYDVSYTKNVQWEYGDIIFADNGDATESCTGYFGYTFKVPDGYDGLVFAAIPANEYTSSINDTETVSGTGTTEEGEENEEDVYYAFDEGFYVDGTKFFRINRQEDSPITSGANDETDKSSARAVIDDGREQGSIGDSGLPYYRLGFSPEDFTIGGLSVYDGKNLDEMYEAVDLQDAGSSVGDNVVWVKKNDDLNDRVVFSLHLPDHIFQLVDYSNDAKKVEMYFSSIDEQNIATADFIQSSVIPGETTFAEAVDALGIQDVIAAMGIQGDAFKDASLIFESQFSEDTCCSISWRDDYRNIKIYWTDSDGKKVELAMWSEGMDVVSSMKISRTH